MKKNDFIKLVMESVMQNKKILIIAIDFGTGRGLEIMNFKLCDLNFGQLKTLSEFVSDNTCCVKCIWGD